MPYDGTQVDIIVNASLPETREIPESCKAVLKEISDAIGGIVVQRFLKSLMTFPMKITVRMKCMVFLPTRWKIWGQII